MITSRERVVGAAAAQFVEELAFKSKLTRRDDDVHEVSWHDIQIETVAGVGGFSRVYRARISNHGDIEDGSYAAKCLNEGTMKDYDIFRTGAIDLAAEAEILSRLQHENIIQLHGHSTGGPLNAFSESEKGYFIVLDLLEDTLQEKLTEYRIKTKRRRIKSFSSHSGVSDRLESIALGVARGVSYLHSQGVVIRDLKPDNIGFDRHGTPKLYDFGFAREVHTIDKLEICGSLRYMAPEIMLGHGSTLASDVYSFGILLWELCTLEKPFKDFSSGKLFKKNVFAEGYRPSLTSIRSAALSGLISDCWDPSPINRPHMDHVIKILRVEIALGVVHKKDSSFGRGIQRLSSMSVKPAARTLKKMNSWSARKLSASTLSWSSGMSNLLDKSGEQNEESKNAEFRKNSAGGRPNPFLRQSNLTSTMDIVDNIEDYPDYSSGVVEVSIHLEDSEGKNNKSIEAMLNDIGMLMPEPEEQNLKPSLEETWHSSVPVFGTEWDSEESDEDNEDSKNAHFRHNSAGGRHDPFLRKLNRTSTMGSVDEVEDFPGYSSGEVEVSIHLEDSEGKNSKSIGAMLNDLGMLMPEPEEQNLKPSLEETWHSSVPGLDTEWDSIL
jgi:serine/threonine protein kinase